MSYRWISERGKGGGRKGEAISGNVEAAKSGGEIFKQVKGGSFINLQQQVKGIVYQFITGERQTQS